MPTEQQPLDPDSSIIAETGNCVLNFFRSIPDKVRSIPQAVPQAVKELLDVDEEESSSSESSAESPHNARLLKESWLGRTYS